MKYPDVLLNNQQLIFHFFKIQNGLNYLPYRVRPRTRPCLSKILKTQPAKIETQADPGPKILTKMTNPQLCYLFLLPLVLSSPQCFACVNFKVQKHSESPPQSPPHNEFTTLNLFIELTSHYLFRTRFFNTPFQAIFFRVPAVIFLLVCLLEFFLHFCTSQFCWALYKL